MNIVVLDGYTLNPGDLSWADLEALGALTVYDRTSPVDVLARAEGAACLLTNKTRLPGEVLAQLPELKYVGVLATGYDVIDIHTAHARGITATNIPTYGTHSVAQMVIAQIYTFCHRVEAHSTAAREGQWTASPDWSYWVSPQVELLGKTLGVVGLGRIGTQVARIAAALGMQVQAYDAYQRAIDDIPDFQWVELDELFKSSDVISLNCPLTPDTEGIINQETISLMKPTVLLINASRGGLVVEDDLADALNNDRIAGAGLDVLSTEPPSPDNPLLSAKNTVITSHIAWATREARQRLMTTAVENLKAFQAGKPQNVIQPKS